MNGRHWWIALLVVVVPLHAPRLADAACNQLTSIYASPAPTPGFRGALGMVNRPFVEPDGPIRIGRGGCDPSPSATFPPPDKLLVTVLLKDPPRDADALIIAGDQQCGQAERDACKNELGVAGRAICANKAEPLRVIDNGRQVVFTFPDLGKNQMSRTAGDLTIVLTERGTSGCGVAKRTCTAWRAAGTTGKLACVDQLFGDLAVCSSTAPHASFTALTALPPMLDFHRTCHADGKHCADVERGVSYTIDRDENVLVPVLWRDIYPSAEPTPGKALARGDVVMPRPWKPTSDALESFTAEGQYVKPNDFVVDASALGKVSAVSGTADNFYSIIRMRNFRCDGGSAKNRPCRPGDACPDGASCARLSDVAADMPPTGANTLAHGAKHVCEDETKVDCSTAACNAGKGDCVGYVLTATGHGGPAPATFPRNRSPLTTIVEAAFAAIGTLIDIDDSKETVAAIIEFRDAPPELAGVEGKRALLVADPHVVRKAANDAERRAAFEVVRAPDGTMQTAERVRQYDGQTRFLSAELASTELGDASLAVMPGPTDRLLKVYDRTRKKLTVVAVAEPADGERDPLAVQQTTGLTKFVSPAGQCVTNDGLVLPVPSTCRPVSGTEDCPRGAACRPARVVVATHLLDDGDGDAIPDPLDP